MVTIAKYYPYVIALVIGATFYHYQHSLTNLEEVLKKILDAALTICGVLLGFLLTILTMISTIATRRMQFVKDSGAYPLLNYYLKTALYSNLITISFYFILPFLIPLENADAKDVINAVLIFLISFTWITNIRFSSVFIRLMSDPDGH